MLNILSPHGVTTIWIFLVTVSTGKPNGAFLIYHCPYGKSMHLAFPYHCCSKERLSSNFVEECDPDEKSERLKNTS